MKFRKRLFAGKNIVYQEARKNARFLWLTLIFFSAQAGLRGESGDHLVPLREYYGNAHLYSETWKKKLFVTSAEIARYIHLPANADGVEESVAVYRSKAENGHSDSYWVTVTQAKTSLAHFFESDPPDLSGAEATKIRRWDVPLPESLARNIRDAWTAMLRRTTTDACVGCVSTDSSTEIFSVNDEGVELVAQLSIQPKRDALALLDLAGLLIDYTRVPQSEREAVAGGIMRKSSKLLVDQASNESSE